MKTQQTYTTREGRQTTRQALIVIAGLAVAVLCSLVLMRETSPPPDQSTTIAGTAVSIITERVADLADVSVLRVLSLFK